VPVVSCLVGTSINLVLALHLLNTITTNGGSGNWLNNLAQTAVAAFGGVIVPAILAGGNPVEAIFSDQAGCAFKSFAILWYIINYDIPACPVKFNLWAKVADAGGEALNLLLTFGTLMFTTSLTVAAVSGPQALLSSAWFAAIATGVVAGNAGSFFPLNKGFTLPNNDALAISFTIASGGLGHVADAIVNKSICLLNACTFKVLDSTLQLDCKYGGMADDLVTSPFGGLANFVVVVVALNYFFGEMSGLNLRNGFDAFGLVDKLLELFQLA